MRILYLLEYRPVPGLKTIKILLTPAKFAKIIGIVQDRNRLKKYNNFLNKCDIELKKRFSNN